MTGWPGEALDAADELLVCKTVARGHLERAAERAAERDALAAFAQGLQVATDSLRAERDALAAKVERVRALHIATPFWQLTPEGYAPDMESTAPDGAMCLACSEEHVTDDFENWELDLSDSGVVHYPCPTIRALDEEADA